MIIDFFLLGGSKNFVQNESEGRELKPCERLQNHRDATVNTDLQSIQPYSQYRFTVNTALQSIQHYSQYSLTVNIQLQSILSACMVFRISSSYLVQESLHFWNVDHSSQGFF